jgi:hypothetical protein
MPERTLLTVLASPVSCLIITASFGIIGRVGNLNHRIRADRSLICGAADASGGGRLACRFYVARFAAHRTRLSRIVILPLLFHLLSSLLIKA